MFSQWACIDSIHVDCFAIQPFALADQSPESHVYIAVLGRAASRWSSSHKGGSFLKPYTCNRMELLGSHPDLQRGLFLKGGFYLIRILFANISVVHSQTNLFSTFQNLIVELDFHIKSSFPWHVFGLMIEIHEVTWINVKSLFVWFSRHL